MSEKQTAGEIIAAELQGLCTAGAGFVPTPPPAKPTPIVMVAESAATLAVDPQERRLLLILAASVPMGRNEIAGGLNLQREKVDDLLERLLVEGKVLRTNEDGLIRFTVPQDAKPSPAPVVPYVNRAQADSAAAQKREREKQKLLHPEPPLKKPIALEDVVLPEPAKPLTDDEIKEWEISHRNRRLIANPQSWIVR
jgi:hypothetical protein